MVQYWDFDNGLKSTVFYQAQRTPMSAQQRQKQPESFKPIDGKQAKEVAPSQITLSEETDESGSTDSENTTTLTDSSEEEEQKEEKKDEKKPPSKFAQPKPAANRTDRPLVRPIPAAPVSVPTQEKPQQPETLDPPRKQQPPVSQDYDRRDPYAGPERQTPAFVPYVPYAYGYYPQPYGNYGYPQQYQPYPPPTGVPEQQPQQEHAYPPPPPRPSTPEPDYDARPQPPKAPPKAPEPPKEPEPPKAAPKAAPKAPEPPREPSRALKKKRAPPPPAPPPPAKQPEPRRKRASHKDDHPRAAPVQRPGTPVSEASTRPFLSSFGLVYIDFYPTDSQRKITDLVHEANGWLEENKTMQVVSLETVEIPYGIQSQRRNESALYQTKSGENWFMRKLRMWVCEKDEDDEEAQEVHHVNLYPAWEKRNRKSHRNTPTMPHFEDMDKTIERANKELSDLKNQNDYGKVLCMETLSRLPAYHEMGVPIYLDPDTCVWDEQRTRDMYYVSILRLFFVRGQPTPEIIGVQDFVPECTTPKDPKTAESIDRQVSVASDWMKSYPGVRVTNIQTIYHKVDDGWDGSGMDTRRPLYRRGFGSETRFLACLRVYYALRIEGNVHSSTDESKFGLANKVFMPMSSAAPSRGKQAAPKIESQQKAAKRLTAYVITLSEEVPINVETVAVCGSGKMKFDPDSSLCSESGDNGTDNHLLVFRLYTSPTTGDQPPSGGHRGSTDYRPPGGNQPAPNDWDDDTESDSDDVSVGEWPYEAKPGEAYVNFF